MSERSDGRGNRFLPRLSRLTSGDDCADDQPDPVEPDHRQNDETDHACGNNTPAMGTPVASDFLDSQNMNATRQHSATAIAQADSCTGSTPHLRASAFAMNAHTMS